MKLRQSLIAVVLENEWVVFLVALKFGDYFLDVVEKHFLSRGLAAESDALEKVEFAHLLVFVQVKHLQKHFVVEFGGSG